MSLVKNFSFLALVSALVLFAGFKPSGFDRDYYNYYNYFIEGDIDWFRFEPFFNVIVILVNYLGLPFYIFLTIISLISIYIKYKFIRALSSSALFSLLVYISFFYILHDLTQIRVALALSFILISVYFFLDKKHKISLFFMFAGVLFHYSVLIFVILFIFNSYNKKIFWYALPAIGFFLGYASPVIASFLIGYLPELISWRLRVYLESEEHISNPINIFNYHASFSLLIYYFVLTNVDRLKSYKVECLIFVKMLGFGLFFFYALSFIPVLSFRIFELFSISLVFLFPFVVLFFKQKLIVSLFLISYIFLYFFRTSLNLLATGFI